LASVLARDRGRRVLLVEADFRRPSITPTLGLPRAPGLSEWLNGDLDYVPVRVVEPGAFFLLVAGQAKLERPEVLGSARMDALLRKARESFGFVLLDLAPVLPVADTVLVEQLIDGYLMVARSRQTPRAAVRDALEKIDYRKVIGLVLNDHHEYQDSYRAYAYQRYGMGHGSHSSHLPGARRSTGRQERS
jgi:non-specific protein-tyrosine kinase